MQDIVASKGFQSITRAMRNATVYALQTQKQKKHEREVHFGLAQKWKQKIKGGEKEFMAALAEFVQQYNWESENLDAKLPGDGWKHHKVSAGDLDELLVLLNRHGAELVGMLLLAYGYARMPKQDTLEQEQEQEKEVV